MHSEKDIWDEIEQVCPPDSLDDEMFELISAYADGECSTKERRLVEAYLAENPAAEQILSEIRIQSSVMLHQAEPPSWLKEEILKQTIGVSKPKALPTLRWAIPALAAAAIAGIWLYPRTNTNQPGPTGADLLAVTPGKPSNSSEPGQQPNSRRGVVPDSHNYASNEPITPQVRTAGRSEGPTVLNASKEVPELVGGAPPKADLKPSGSAGGSGSTTPSETKEKKPIVMPTVEVPTADPARPDLVAVSTDDQSGDTLTAEKKPKSDESAESREALRQALREHNTNKTDIKEGAKGLK